MAGVVAQMLDLDFGGRFQLRPFAFTMASGAETLPRRSLRHLRQAMYLRKSIAIYGVRIVHLHTCSGFTFLRSALDARVARGAGCKVALHIHGAAFDQFCRQASSWKRRLIARALCAADRVVALSQGWADQLKAFAPNANITVIENAVDIPLDAQPTIMPHPCRFLLLARMDAWKGIDDFLDACTMLRGTALAFEALLAGPPGTAGDAPILERKISERKLSDCVRYVGLVHGSAKDDLLRRADVCIQPSHHEGLPLAVLEAMAHGKSVIATRVGALPEVIEHGHHGLLVPPRCPQLLAEAMQEVAVDLALRQRMGGCARELANQRFSLTRLRDDLACLYESLAQEPAGARRPRRAPRASERLALTTA